MKNKISIICEVCSKEFQLYPSQVGHDRGKYCSRECSKKGQRKTVPISCHMCGVSFYRRPGEQDIGKRKNQFCSRECYFSFRKQNRKNTYPKIGSVHEHRIVAEKKIGRKLKRREVVHHKDEDKTNNEPSNLLVFKTQSDHARFHMEDKWKTNTKTSC